MAKLRLTLDELHVDSFDTASSAAGKGTVFGEQCTCYTNCTCPGCPTCDYTACDQNTCPATCFGSCGGSCYYTECGGNTLDDPTCNPTNGGAPDMCCPY